MHAFAFTQRTLLPTPNTSKNPDQTKFTEYLSWTAIPDLAGLQVVTNSLVPETTQFLSLPTELETPLYAIKSRSGAQSKPDIELHLGPDLGSPLVAVGRLHIKRHDFGVADISKDGPDSCRVERVLTKDGRGEEFMAWESLKQITKWTYRVFEFQWGVG
jgi:hypothetical protein